MFRCIINGKSGSGKTNLLLNILVKIFERYEYVLLIICSRTIDQFLYQDFIKETESNYTKNIILQSKDISIFKDNNLFESLNAKKVGKYKKIIILDDILVHNKDMDTLYHLFSSTRPREISLFYLSQRFTQLDIRCQQQINYFITFKQNEIDLKFISKELGLSLKMLKYKLNHNVSNFKSIFCDLEEGEIYESDFIFNTSISQNFIGSTDINDLIFKLKILIGEKNAGNDSKEIINKIKIILNELDRIGLIELNY